jgi:hypothetical protein
VEVEKINQKTIAISLILLTTLAAAVGALTLTAFATADTNSTNTITSTAITADTTQNIDQIQFAGNMMMDNQGFGGGPGGHGGHGQMMGVMNNMNNVEVGTEYTANVNAILGNDSDVQNLVAQGYNVTSINPIVKTVIQEDGTIATQATNAAVILTNGTSGFATVKVDVANAKVTQIITITRTVIDKSTT